MEQDLNDGARTASSGLDSTMLVVASASGCLFIIALFSCVCCYRRNGRRRDPQMCSRRDTVPLEDLLSKPTLADPESFFSEGVLNDQDPSCVFSGYCTSNDGTSMANVSHHSDSSTNELVANDSGHAHLSTSGRKYKSEKVKQSKNFQTLIYNNDVKSTAYDNRRHSDQHIDSSTQSNIRIKVNETQHSNHREDEALRKSADIERYNNDTGGARAGLNKKLKKTENNSQTKHMLGIAVTEDRVSFESLNSSARGSISHDMTSSVNVLRLPRPSIIPPPEDWNDGLSGNQERTALLEVNESPISPIEAPSALVSTFEQSSEFDEGQVKKSGSATSSNALIVKNHPSDTNKTVTDDGNTSKEYSVENVTQVQENTIQTRESVQPRQQGRNNNSNDQTNGRIPERISLNLQIDFHFSDKSGCTNQTRSYVVCSPVSVSQDIKRISPTIQDAIASDKTSQFPQQECQNKTMEPGAGVVATVITDDTKPCLIGNQDQRDIEVESVAVKGNDTPFPHDAFNFFNTSYLKAQNKRFSTPVTFSTTRETTGVGPQNVEKRRFTVANITDVGVIEKERKMIGLHCSNVDSMLVTEKDEQSLKEVTENNAFPQSSDASEQSKTSDTSQSGQTMVMSDSSQLKVEQQESVDISSQKQSVHTCLEAGNEARVNDCNQKLENSSEESVTEATKDQSPRSEDATTNKRTHVTPSQGQNIVRLQSQESSTGRQGTVYETPVREDVRCTDAERTNKHQSAYQDDEIEKAVENKDNNIRSVNRKSHSSVNETQLGDLDKHKREKERETQDERCLQENDKCTKNDTEADITSDVTVDRKVIQTERETRIAQGEEQFVSTDERVIEEEATKESGIEKVVAVKKISDPIKGENVPETQMGEKDMLKEHSGNIGNKENISVTEIKGVKGQQCTDCREDSGSVSQLAQNNSPIHLQHKKVESPKENQTLGENPNSRKGREHVFHQKQTSSEETGQSHGEHTGENEKLNEQKVCGDNTKTVETAVPAHVDPQPQELENKIKPTITNAADANVPLVDRPYPKVKGILRVRSFDMAFKEQDNVNIPLGSNSFQSAAEREQFGSRKMAPLVVVSGETNIDEPCSETNAECSEGKLSPNYMLETSEDKGNASDESDYDNPWDSLDEAVMRGSMRYNRRSSRLNDGDDAKTLMLKSAEDLGRLLEDAERRRRLRQNADRSSCQIPDSPPAPPPRFTRSSPFRHTVKGLVSHSSDKDLQDDALKPRPLKGKKNEQKSKDDLAASFSTGIDPNRSKTLAACDRSKMYSPETKKRKGLLHRW